MKQWEYPTPQQVGREGEMNAWRERDDLSIFLAPKLELGSVVD